jgi:hypothetical protein
LTLFSSAILGGCSSDASPPSGRAQNVMGTATNCYCKAPRGTCVLESSDLCSDTDNNRYTDSKCQTQDEATCPNYVP